MMSSAPLLLLLTGVAFSWDPDELWCPTKTLCDNDVQPLGCFDQGPTTPWCHMSFLPKSVSDVKPRFWFVAPGDTWQELPFDKDLDTHIRALGHLNASLELFGVIHGFGGGFPRFWTHPMVDALNDLGHNVVVVDWTGGSSTLNYLQAAATTRTMGAAFARMMELFRSARGVQYEQMTLVGFSLGAHVAGFAGARMPGLRRIIGLDPAGPLYAKGDPFDLGMTAVTRLNHTDAQLVQCIHTDGSTLWEGGAGTIQQFGHIDFLVNGGKLQPGCSEPVPIEPVKEALDDLIKFDCTFDQVTAFNLNLQGRGVVGALGGGCAFEAFPCRNANDWRDGKCTKCGSDGCPIAGVKTDVGTIHQGQYYFDTKATNSTPSLFCGEQFVIQFTTERRVQGDVSFQFGGEDWISSPTVFHMDGDSAQRLIVLDSGEVPQYVQVSYKPDYRNWRAWSWCFHFTTLTLTHIGSNTDSYIGYELPNVDVKTSYFFDPSLILMISK